MTRTNPALEALRRNVTGKIERGEAEAITEMPTPELVAERLTGRQLIAMMREEMAADPDAVDEWAY